jgi:hypothetical protein
MVVATGSAFECVPIIEYLNEVGEIDKELFSVFPEFF